jgi:hypothetical protein
MFKPTRPAASYGMAIALLCSTAAAAETNGPADSEQPDRVLLPGSVKHGGYGAPEIKFTTMTGDAAILAGGQGGWIINHGFVIGGAGYGLTTIHDAPAPFSPANLRSTLQFGYGGPRLGYILYPHDVLHFTFGLLVGGGGYTILSRNDTTNDSYTHDGRGFFVIEPEAELEANLLQFLRLGFGFSYRYVGTRAVSYLQTSDLSGPSASLALRLGAF